MINRVEVAWDKFPRTMRMSEWRHTGRRTVSALLFVLLYAFPVAAGDPPITAITFSSDGHWVSAASQASVKVYDWPSLQLQSELSTSVANVHDLQFSPDSSKLAIGGGVPAEVGIVEIVSWPKGESLHVIRQHDDTVMAVQWLDNTSLATGSLDQRVLICDANSAELVHSLEGHSRGVSTLCHLPGNILVSGGIDQSLRVWDVATGEQQRTLNIHTQPIHAIAMRPAESGLPMIASASDDRTLRFWQPTIGRMVKFAKLPAKPLCLAWVPDGSQVVAGCTDGHVYFVDPDTVEVTQHIAVADGWIYALAIDPHSGAVLTADGDGNLRADQIPR